MISISSKIRALAVWNASVICSVPSRTFALAENARTPAFRGNCDSGEDCNSICNSGYGDNFCYGNESSSFFGCTKTICFHKPHLDT